MVMSLSQVAAPAPGWHRIFGEVAVQLVALGTRCAFSAALSEYLRDETWSCLAPAKWPSIRPEAALDVSS